MAIISQESSSLGSLFQKVNGVQNEDQEGCGADEMKAILDRCTVSRKRRKETAKSFERARKKRSKDPGSRGSSEHSKTEHQNDDESKKLLDESLARILKSAYQKETGGAGPGFSGTTASNHQHLVALQSTDEKRFLKHSALFPGKCIIYCVICGFIQECENDITCREAHAKHVENCPPRFEDSDNVPRIKCRICVKSIDGNKHSRNGYRDDILDHFGRHHGRLFSFGCKQCSMWLPSLQCIAYHMKLAHHSPVAILCSHCWKRHNSLSSWKAHWSDLLTSSTSDPPDQRSQHDEARTCFECYGRLSTNNLHLDCAIQEGLRPKQSPTCGVCGLKFQTSVSAQAKDRHAKTFHNGASFQEFEIKVPNNASAGEVYRPKIGSRSRDLTDLESGNWDVFGVDKKAAKDVGDELEKEKSERAEREGSLLGAIGSDASNRSSLSRGNSPAHNGGASLSDAGDGGTVYECALCDFSCMDQGKTEDHVVREHTDTLDIGVDRLYFWYPDTRKSKG